MSKLKLNTDYLNKPIESDTAIEESKSRFSFNFDYLDTPPEGKEITQKPLSRGEKSIRAFESRLGELTNQLSQIDSAKAPDEYNKTKENIDFIQNSLNNARENFGIDTDKIVRRESGIKQTSPQNAFAMYERFTPAEQSLNVAPREEIGKKTEQVKKLEDELKKREGNLTFLKNKLDSFKLDKTDQKSVNQYNQIVNDINSEVNELQKVYKNYGDTFKNYQQTVEQYLNPLGLPKDVAERNFGKNIPISEDKPLREGKIFSPLEKIGAGLEYGFTTQIPELMSGGIETINQIMANTQLDPTTKALIPAQNYEPDSSILSEASKRLKEFAESNKKEFKQIPADDFLFELTNNGTTFLSSIVLGTAAGLIHPMLAIPVVGMNTFLLEGGESFNNAYDYYKSKGIDEKTAKRAAADQAVVTGTIKAGLESLVPLKVANKLFGKSISKVVDVPLKKKLSNLSLEMFETGVSEARQEFLQATTDIIAESLYKEAKDKPTIEKWLNEGGKSALYGFVLGMFGGGGGNVVEQVRAKKQIDDFAKEFSKILDEKDITIDDVSANEAVLTEYERGKLLGERRGKEFTGFPMEQEQDETANFLKTAYEQLKPSEVSTFTGFPIDQQEPIEKPEKFAATIQNELNRQANIKKKQQEKRNLEKRKKAEQDVFAELNRQVRNAERKKNLIDINALQNLADNIQVQEIKDKAVKSIERARKSNEKIKQRNEFTLENLARKRFGTSNLNSLDEEQQQNLLNEYNSMKAQGIENFGKLNTVIPVIQLPPLLAEERIQGLITPQEPQPQEGLTFEGNVLSQLEGERDARTIRSNQEIAPQRTPGMEREESQRSSSKDLQLETGKQRQPGTSELRKEKREDEEKVGNVERGLKAESQKSEEALPQKMLDKLTYQRSGNDMYVVLPSGRRMLAPNTTSKKKALEIVTPLLKQRIDEGLFEAKESVPPSEEKEAKIDELIKKYQDTGRVAIRYPRKKQISLNGLTYSEEEAIKRMEEVLKEEPSGALPNNINRDNLIEYVTRDVFKTKSLDKAIDIAHSKFNNTENPLLGKGKLEFTKDQLREDFINDKLKTYYKNNTEAELKGISDKFKIPLDELRKKAQSADLLSGKAEIDKAKKSRVNFYEFPPDEINVNTEAMQNRETKFSKQTYDSIVEDVKSGNFDLANIPPVMVYKDDNGKLWTLNHSRLKAYQDLKAEGNKDFNTIPVQEINAESLEEASKLAKEKTNIGAKETPVERAKIYRQMREEGTSENRILQKAKQFEGRNSTHIINLSYLNPIGKTLVTYNQAGENVINSGVIRDVADYIGEARKRYNELTDAHEDELFKWLFEQDQISKFKNKIKFIDNIDAFVKHASFSPEKPLGVGKDKVVRGAATIRVDKKLEEARRQRKEIEKERKDFEEGKIPLPLGLTAQQYLDEFSKKLSDINNEILKLTEDRRKAVEADRLQDDLFSQITEEVPNERASEIITQTNPSELEELAKDIESKEKSKESLSNEEIEEAINKADKIINPEEETTPTPEEKTPPTSGKVTLPGTTTHPEITEVRTTNVNGKKGIEIELKGKPSESLRRELKLHSFRWKKGTNYWYAYHSPRRLQFAKDVAGLKETESKPAEAKTQKPKSLSAEKEDIKKALDDFLDSLGDDIISEEMPEFGEQTNRLTTAQREKGQKLIEAFVNNGIYDFKKIVEDLYNNPKMGERIITLIDGMKEAYGAYYMTAPDEISSKMNIQASKKFDIADIKKKDDITNKDKGESPNEQQVRKDIQGVSSREQTGRIQSTQTERGTRSTSQRSSQPDTGRNLPQERSGERRDDKSDSGGRSLSRIPQQLSSENYLIKDGDGVGEGSFTLEKKFSDNIKALRLLKQLNEESRYPTLEEKQILVRYVGWGGMPQVFNEYESKFEKMNKELRDVLTDKEYKAAKASTINAHYTSPEIIKGIYSATERLGFKGGYILEPSLGIGHFFGFMPEAMQKASTLHGVELDDISAQIAQKLYPKARINDNKPHGLGYQEIFIPSDYYDLAISNVPFGQIAIFDQTEPKSEWAKKTPSIHNFFFMKTIDKIRPGGLMVFITSRYTMDSNDAWIRRYLNDKAKLIGAIRLPNTAFKKNANTEVVTDIIILQKRQLGDPERGNEWTDTDKVKIGKNKEVYLNQYFIEHPEMVLGKHSLSGSMYSKNEYTVIPDKSSTLAEQLDKAISTLPMNIYSEANESERVDIDIATDFAGKKNGSFVKIDGVIYRNINGKPTEAKDLSGTRLQRVDKLIDLKEKLNEVIEAQFKTTDDTEVNRLIKELNKLYDEYVEKFKSGKELSYLTGRATSLAFSEDPDYPRLRALENVDPKTGKVSKADILRKRIFNPIKKIERVESAKDALVASLAEKGKVDIEYMSRISGFDEGGLTEELSDLIFFDPVQKEYVTKDEYLSGDVKTKLERAKEAYGKDPRYKHNVEALEAVIPDDVAIEDVSISLGASWIPVEDYSDFIKELLELSDDLNLKLRYIENDSRYIMDTKVYLGQNEKATDEYGTTDIDGLRLFLLALNHKQPRLTQTYYEDGKRRTKLDPEKTELAKEKQGKIKEAFSKWVTEDNERKEKYHKLYNESFNRIVFRDFDGSHLIFPNLAKEVEGKPFELRPYQKDAVWRIMNKPTTLLAHVVGAGKTAEMIVSAMEMKRIGRIRKPMFVVPNHLVAQWEHDFHQLYPQAKVLAPDKTDFTPKNRKNLAARIATNEWDAVIVALTHFEKLPMSPDYTRDYMQSRIDELDEIIAELEDVAEYGSPETREIKRLEARKLRLQERLRKTIAGINKDDAIKFEELGIDYLYVDEAHNFKNLYMPTQIANIKGVGKSDADRSNDLYMKVQWMHKVFGGNITFATGTPVSNTLTEFFVMMKYLIPNQLKEYGIANLDSWIHNFGEVLARLEVTSTGQSFKVQERLSKIQNLPEMMRFYLDVADIKSNDDVKEWTKPPKIETGKPQVIKVKPSQEILRFWDSLSRRADNIKANPKEALPDNFLALTIDAKKSSVDIRLTDPNAPDNPNSKINTAVEIVTDIYKKETEKKGAQLIFLDEGVPGGVQFNLYEDIKKKLIRNGVKPEEIAFVHSYKTDKQKSRLFSLVNSGEIRVLIGSSGKMSEGMNVQERLKAIHEISVPYKPSQIEQMEGRIIRSGNTYDEVGIYRYVLEGHGTAPGFDAYLWQILETKARAFKSALSRDVASRTLEESDERALTYAETKALATGNPILLERVGVEQELSREERIYRAELDQKNRKRREISSTQAIIDKYNKHKELSAKFSFPKEDTPFKIEGTEYQGKDAKKNFGNAIIDQLKDFIEERENDFGNKEYVAIQKFPNNKKVAEWGSFDILSINWFREPRLLIIDKNLRKYIEENENEFFDKYTHSIASVVKYSKVGGTLSNNIIESVQDIEDYVAGLDNEIKKSEELVEKQKEQIAKPIENEERVHKLRARLRELDKELGLDKDEGTMFDEDEDIVISESMPEFGEIDENTIYSLLLRSYNGLEIPQKRFTTYLDKDGEHSLDLWAEEKARVVKSFLRNFVTPKSYEKFNDYRNRVLRTIPELRNATESLEKKIRKALRKGKAEKISLSSASRDFNLTETEIQKLQERLSERDTLAAEPLEELKPYTVKESDLKLIEKKSKIRLSIYDREKIFGSKDGNKQTKGRVEQALRESRVQPYPGQRSTGVEQANRKRTSLGRDYEQTNIESGIPKETIPQEIRPVLYHFAKKGSINVIGLQLGQNYLQDIADSYYIFRNPFIEVLHFIGRDANNKIIESIPVTSNASNYIDISNLEEIINRLKERGAKKVTVLHNHPSGVPVPSASDYKTIAAFRKEFKKQADIDVDSSVVINGDRYASWDVTDDGIYNAQLFSYESPKTHPLDKFYRDFDQSAKIKIGNAKDAAKYFSQLRYGKGNIAVVVLDNHLRIRGWDIVSKRFKDDTENFADYVEQLLRVKAGSRTILVGNKEDFDISDLESIEDEYGVYHKKQQKIVRSSYTTRLIDLSIVYDKNNFIAIKEYETKIRGKAETILSEQLEEFNKKQDIFYSQLERVTEAKAPGTITPKNFEQYLAMLKKNGVKDEEIEWLGVEDFVKEQGKVSKDELVDFIRQNNVRIEEVEKGKRKFNRGDLIVEKTDYGYKLVDENGTQFSDLTTAQAKEVTDIENALLDEANKYLGSGLATTKFSQWQEPGAENYREMLLTLPPKAKFNFGNAKLKLERLGYTVSAEGKVSKDGVEIVHKNIGVEHDYNEKIYSLGGKEIIAEVAPNEEVNNLIGRINDARKEANVKYMQDQFKSTHFDEPNILAHVRMNDRIDAEGRKILFLEEVQSDFGQSIRGERNKLKEMLQDKTAYERIIAKMNRDGEVRIECP